MTHLNPLRAARTLCRAPATAADHAGPSLPPNPCPSCMAASTRRLGIDLVFQHRAARFTRGGVPTDFPTIVDAILTADASADPRPLAVTIRNDTFAVSFGDATDATAIHNDIRALAFGDTP